MAACLPSNVADSFQYNVSYGIDGLVGDVDVYIGGGLVLDYFLNYFCKGGVILWDL